MQRCIDERQDGQVGLVQVHWHDDGIVLSYGIDADDRDTIVHLPVDGAIIVMNAIRRCIDQRDTLRRDLDDNAETDDFKPYPPSGG